MPFKQISERKVLSVGSGATAATVISFLSMYKNAKITLVGSDIVVSYQRDETPAEKALRMVEKVATPEPTPKPTPEPTKNNKPNKGKK